MACYDYKDVPCCIRDRCTQFIMSEEKLRSITKLLNSEINKGLSKATNSSAAVKCFVTYVQDLPNGKEKGKYLALDLGGTNFRVLLVELKGGECDMKSKIYEMPKTIIVGEGKLMFDHIAECLLNFIEEHGLKDEALPLGFTFSFPCKQVGLTEGRLEQWTKGFNCDHVVGEDVVGLLNKSILEKGINIEIMAILNDTTGTLMACAWKESSTLVGLIIGTGTNACYVESIEKAELFDGDKSKPYVVINTEWGAFGDDGSLEDIRTEYDRAVDNSTINPKRQTFEKMISGMYMGELVRLVLLGFAEEGLFLPKAGGNFGKFKTEGAFETKFVSKAEKDDEGVEKYTHARNALKEMDIPDNIPTDQDLLTVRYVSELISTRASDLASAGVCALVQRMGEKCKKNVTVGVDGTVYKLHPHFSKRMQKRCQDLSSDKVNVNLMLSEDGSGRGAALVAAVASRQSKASQMQLGADTPIGEKRSSIKN